MRRPFGVLAHASIFSLTGIALAQQSADPHMLTDGRPTAPKVFGTLQTGIYNVGADDMAARALQWDNFVLGNNSYATPANKDSLLALSGPIHLDSGVLLESATIFFSDTNTEADLSGEFLRSDTLGGSESIFDVDFPTGAPGNQTLEIVFPPDTVIDNENYVYAFNVILTNNGLDGTHRFYRARIRYRRQVSPDPPFSTFNDVLLGHPFHQFIEALAAAGITGGCSAAPPLYCPDAPLTRGQMAVFLSKALGLHFPN